MRLTTKESDSIKITNLENSILNGFNPSHLTELHRLNEKADIYFFKTAFRDSILLGSAMGAAYEKINWVMENVPDRERASGFPGHYLDLQLSACKEFISFEKTHKYSQSEYTENYLKELNSLINAGFLDEFMMKQFFMVMIVSPTHQFDFEEYDKWISTNNITLDLNQLFYVIGFGQE